MTRKTVYNKNLVTSEKWSLVNEENKELLQEFLDYKRSTSKSEGTLLQYEAMLRIFFVWVSEKAKNKHFTEITKRDFIRFQGYCLTDLGHSSNRIRTVRSSISSLGIFVENILDDEYPTFKSLINKIEPPVKSPVREKTILSFEECEKIADDLVERGKIQMACFMMVASYSGLRKQELTRLLVKDFTTNVNMALGNSFYKTTPIKVKGHGLRVESKYVWNKCDKWLKLWLDYRLEKGIECEYLFVRRVKDEWLQSTVSTANGFANRLTAEFGVPIYCHSFRHLLVSELERSGLPMTVAQFLLGHGNLSVTELYNDVPKDEALEQFGDFFRGDVKTVKKKSLGDL
ncbi:MAG: tyrosine-type recombinase/integrase [Fusobacteriaceae bacterium]